jgi:hypothetical protein
MQDPVLNFNFEAELDAALKRPPDVRVPEHFSQRLFARLPESMDDAPAAPRSTLWILPALALASAATLGALGIAAVDLGWTRWLTQELTQPSVVVTILAIESVLSLAWVWRLTKAAR